MGLSIYIVCRQGASNPVRNMSRTMSSLSGSLGSFRRLPMALRRSLLRICSCQSSGSLAEPVITILIAPFSSSGVVPLRTQFDDFMVKSHTDAPAHANDHALAVGG